MDLTLSAPTVLALRFARAPRPCTLRLRAAGDPSTLRLAVASDLDLTLPITVNTGGDFDPADFDPGEFST